MNYIRKLYFIILTIAFTASPAFAFKPQLGIWMVDSEVTGRSGRGFQLDLQKNTLVFTLYGYHSDGTPSFYLAAGELINNKFEANLDEYAGGIFFGSAPRDAQRTGSPGKVSIEFTSGTKGNITFPGEPKKDITRYTFSDVSPSLNRSFKGEAYGIGQFSSDSSTFAFALGSGALSMTRSSFFSGTCKFAGSYTLAGSTVNSNGTYQCSDFSTGSYSANNLLVNEVGQYTGVFIRTPTGTSSPIVEVHSGM